MSIPSATGVLRASSGDAGFEADFADLAARFAAQSGGGLSAELSADLALEIVLNEVVEQACLATGATGAAIVLERNGEMVCRASSGSTAPELGARLDSASGISGECIRTRHTQRSDDVLADPRVDAEASARLGVRSVMVMPLLRETELVGVFELFSSLPGAFGERDERTLEALSGRILSNLILSTEPFVESGPLQEPPAVPGPDSAPVPAALSVSDSFMVSEPVPVHESLQEIQREIAENPPTRGVDFLTAVLGVAVLACAVLLGVLLGRHLGLEKPSARNRRTAPVSATTPVASAPVENSLRAPNEQKNEEKEEEQKKVIAAPPVAPVRGGGDTIPPGSLSVYENGKEVFRQSPAQSEIEGRQAKSSPLVPGSGMQRAASVAPEPNPESSPAAVVLQRVEPEYPESARQLQLQGPVVLDVRIGQDGGVQQMSLVSGQPLLVQAAEDAVKQWHFKPPVVDGHPATTQTRITLNFRLPQ